jgi:hypothetical protein
MALSVDGNAALGQAIQQKKTGLPSVNADIEDPSTPAGTFWAAMDILSDQSVGSTPALRSALFKVMAEQPGIANLGSARTRSGRAGVGLQVTAGHDRADNVPARQGGINPCAEAPVSTTAGTPEVDLGAVTYGATWGNEVGPQPN